MSDLKADLRRLVELRRRARRCHDSTLFTREAMATDFAGIRQEIEQLEAENQRQRLLLQAAGHLLMAAKGPEDGPTSWIETRDRLLDKLKEAPND